MEATATYTATRTAPSSTVPSGPPQIIEPPLPPRTRALVVGLRRVLLLAVDVLGEYAGLPKRGVE